MSIPPSSSPSLVGVGVGVGVGVVVVGGLAAVLALTRCGSRIAA